MFLRPRLLFNQCLSLGYRGLREVKSAVWGTCEGNGVEGAYRRKAMRKAVASAEVKIEGVDWVSRAGREDVGWGSEGGSLVRLNRVRDFSLIVSWDYR